MTKHDFEASVIRHTVTSLHRIYDSTVQRFNDLTWRSHSSFRAASAFTILELLVAITIIIILAGLVLAATGYVRQKAARSRAESEIAAMAAAIESYKTDNGTYPPHDGSNGAHALYEALAGDGNDLIGGVTPAAGTPGSSGTSYMMLRNNMLRPNPPDASAHVVDPFGNDYGYRTPLAPNAVNPTFDLWSSANANPITDESQWIKNW
jgi:type II secretory pathway pseudopilin PulG